VERGLPPLDRLREAEVSALTFREAQVCLDAALGREPSGLRLEHAAPAIDPHKEREAIAQRLRVEDFVREPMRARARERAGDELSVGATRVQAAGLREEPLAPLGFELAPEIPRAAKQRDVIGMLVIREPDDPREAARGTKGMAAVEPIETEHGGPAFREVVRGRAPVRAQARDDDVRSHER